MMKLLRLILNVQAVGLVLFLAPLMLSAQNPLNGSPAAQASFTGNYQSVAKSSTGEALMTLQLADNAGRFSGYLITAQGRFEVVKGQLVDGLLSLDLDSKGSPAKLSVRRREDKLAGEFSRAGQSETIELKRIDELSGEWEAIANVDGQNFPFALTLKIEGDKITGGSTSELGSSTISKGIFKDGSLYFQLDGSAGTIIMTANLQDGSLIGDFDFSGQVQGRWVAVRRK